MLEERGRVRAPPRPSRDAPALRGCIWATTWFASLTGVPSPPRRYDGGGRDPVRKGGCWLGGLLVSIVSRASGQPALAGNGNGNDRGAAHCACAWANMTRQWERPMTTMIQELRGLRAWRCRREKKTRPLREMAPGGGPAADQE